MIAGEDRLREMLGAQALAWLVDRLRRRLRQGIPLNGVVTLSAADASQRDAVDRLFGRRSSSGKSVTVRLDELDRLIRDAGLSGGLTAAIEAITGPIVDDRARRAALNARWATFFETVEQDHHGDPAVCAWLQHLRDSGLLRRFSRHDSSIALQLVDHALAIGRRLPAQGLPLAELAASITGDSHALDRGRPLGTLATRLAASMGGMDDIDAPDRRRRAWASVGVLCDELSAPVLALNLNSATHTITGRALRMHAEAGEPYRLTVRQLLRTPPVFDSNITGPTVFVCENPTVMAVAANRLGASSAPLLCLEGQPKTAAGLLMARLVNVGIRLAYHGDFDWPGVMIANFVMRRHDAVSWRFSVGDYRAAVKGGLLDGRPVAACWDPDLEEEMTNAGRAVHEESVLDDLVRDLSEVYERGKRYSPGHPSPR